MKVSISPHSYQHTLLSVFFIFFIQIVWFSFAFPCSIWCWASFQVLTDHSYNYLEKLSRKILCPFFKLGWLSFHYWLPLSDTCFANTYIHYMVFPFPTWMVFSCHTKIFSFYEVQFMGVVFLLLVILTSYLRNYCLTQDHEDLLRYVLLGVV